jgi:hypothetical protein
MFFPGGVFVEGPVDRICGAPVRAKRTNSVLQIRGRSILCGSWPKGQGSTPSLVSKPDLTYVGDRVRECQSFLTNRRRRRRGQCVEAL